MTDDQRDTPTLHVYESAEEVARAVALRFVELARDAVESRGRFAVALAGGSTPRRVYELLAGEEFEPPVDWRRVHVFFGDERCVPADDAQSNYRMAREAMLAHLPIPATNVHRIEGLGDARANARRYEDELRGFFDGAEWPGFDLVLLGMGDDGHTASLFPGTSALSEQRAWVVANAVEKLGAWRITLTAPAINHARHVAFVVTGAGKSARLREVLRGARDTSRLPSQLIHPKAGTLEWFLDSASAAEL